MCGIAGILSLTDRPVAPDLLDSMTSRLAHRGPDGRGQYASLPVSLGHRRLSIIDLAAGAQPMHTDDHSISVTYNGEIFNYLELRDELSCLGHRFLTTSDTEVLLRLYSAHGDDCVSMLNGQWAFAIWDSRSRHLLLSRDRVGVRPLFYTVADGMFLFASEIKALLAVPSVPRSVDPVALDHIFTFGTTLPPRTVFSGIRELPAGCSLTVDNGAPRTHRHWALDYSAAQDPAAAFEHSSERLLDLLSRAVAVRLRSDVPVGAYLSGGLDSSLVVALMAQLGSAPLKTFSLAFTDAAFDESSYQTIVSAAFQTEHHSLRCSRADIARVFPDVIWHTEKPLLWTAPAPLLLLSRLVREAGIKVVLTGEGSDEFFAGYDIFKDTVIRERLAPSGPSASRSLQAARRTPLTARSGVFASSAPAPAHIADKAERLFFSHFPRWAANLRLRSLFSPAVRDVLARHDTWAELESLLPAEYMRWDRLSQAQYLEASYMLPGYLLSSQGDRMAMANAIEGRFPFLDRHVVEFAVTLPHRLKLHGLTEKYVLRQAAATRVPGCIVERVKQPYRAPQATAFLPLHQRDKVPDYVRELLSPASVARFGVFDAKAVTALTERLLRTGATCVTDDTGLVAVLSTQLLLEQFVAPARAPGRLDV